LAEKVTIWSSAEFVEHWRAREITAFQDRPTGDGNATNITTATDVLPNLNAGVGYPNTGPPAIPFADEFQTNLNPWARPTVFLTKVGVRSPYYAPTFPTGREERVGLVVSFAEDGTSSPVDKKGKPGCGWR